MSVREIIHRSREFERKLKRDRKVQNETHNYCFRNIQSRTTADFFFIMIYLMKEQVLRGLKSCNGFPATTFTIKQSQEHVMSRFCYLYPFRETFRTN
jgi:hypothetical protein